METFSSQRKTGLIAGFGVPARKPSERGKSGKLSRKSERGDASLTDGGARTDASSHRTRELAARQKGTRARPYPQAKLGVRRRLSQGPSGEASRACVEWIPGKISALDRPCQWRWRANQAISIVIGDNAVWARRLPRSPETQSDESRDINTANGRKNNSIETGVSSGCWRDDSIDNAGR